MAVDPSMNNDDKALLRRRLSASDTLPTATVRPTFLQNLAANVSSPSGLAGIGMPPDPNTQAVGDQTMQRVQAAQTAASAPAPADAFSDVQGGASVGLKRLAPGVSRYALGGDIAGPNATPIYTTRGQHGEAVFTDNANFAANQSTGGLRRDTVNPTVYANSQQSANNPNANYQFSDQSALNQKGLQRRDFQNLDPEATSQALAMATAGSSAGEEGLSNRMDANLLRARQVTQQQSAGGGAGGMNGIPVAQQIALMNAQNRNKLGEQRNAIAAGQLDETHQARMTAQQNADRQQAGDFFKQYQTLKQTDPAKAADYLVASIPQEPDQFDKWAKTTTGRQALNTYLTDVLQSGAKSSLYPLEIGDKRAVSHLGYSNLALGPDGQFQGFNQPDGSGNQYPAKSGFLGVDNYDSSVNRLPPAILQRLKKLGH
jgi:hypothetical protein